MPIEHVGFLVSDPISMGRWYCDHLGLRLLRSSGDDTAGGVFLKDANSGTILELCKPAGKSVYDYRALDPLQAHLAIACDDPFVLADKLVQAGATVLERPPRNPEATEIVMVRDPWGFSLQLIKRIDVLEA